MLTFKVYTISFPRMWHLKAPLVAKDQLKFDSDCITFLGDSWKCSLRVLWLMADLLFTLFEDSFAATYANVNVWIRFRQFDILADSWNHIYRCPEYLRRCKISKLSIWMSFSFYWHIYLLWSYQGVVKHINFGLCPCVCHWPFFESEQ